MRSQLPFGNIHFSLDYTGSVGTKYKHILKELELKKKSSHWYLVIDVFSYLLPSLGDKYLVWIYRVLVIPLRKAGRLMGTGNEGLDVPLLGPLPVLAFCDGSSAVPPSPTHS